MKVLSLGWGVQSFTLAAMVALGQLESIDFAIHADTTHESSLTYDFAKRWTPWLEERGVKIVTIQPPRADVLYPEYKNRVEIPAYTVSKNGKSAQAHRQCTGDWKIEPMKRWISAELVRQGVKKTPGVVEQWIGISLDEWQRMKENKVKYIKNRWPLIEKRRSRHDCEKWLKEHGLEVPSKSACVFCPYHSTKEWAEIKSSPGDWSKAVFTDNSIRNSLKYGMFVHPSRKPLDEVDFRTAEEKGQLSLWDNECSGICGV
jgi:hypothetical protein